MRRKADCDLVPCGETDCLARTSPIRGLGSLVASGTLAVTFPGLRWMNLPEFSSVSSGCHPAQPFGVYARCSVHVRFREPTQPFCAQGTDSTPVEDGLSPSCIYVSAFTAPPHVRQQAPPEGVFGDAIGFILRVMDELPDSGLELLAHRRKNSLSFFSR